jgi:pimeloyl-ACP methyl ester carboxylesterase
MSFALDQLGDSKTRRQLLYNYPHSIDLSQVAAIGYSIGGAAAAAAVASDNRILGGLNMDGRLFDPVLSNGLSKPFMQIGRPGHKEQDSTWDQFWSHLRGPAIELSITGTTHGSYPDTLSLLSALDLPHVVWDMLKAEYGAIDPRNMEEDLDGALTAFLQFLFTEEKGPLADIHESFPDINIVRSKLAKY